LPPNSGSWNNLTYLEVTPLPPGESEKRRPPPYLSLFSVNPSIYQHTNTAAFMISA